MRSVLAFSILTFLLPITSYSQDTVAVRSIDDAIAQSQKGHHVSLLLYLDSNTTFPSQFQQIPKENLIGLIIDNCGYTDFPSYLAEYDRIFYLRYSWFLFDDCPLHKIPDVVYDLKGLETLTLERMPITSVSNRLSNLQQLESLSLYDGELSQFPEEVLSLTNLKSLNLSANNFTSIPSSISRLPLLEELEFNGGASGATPIQSLPDNIGALKNLEYLTFGYSKVGIGDLPDSFYDLKNLRLLSCNGCGISGFDERIANLPLEFLGLMNTYKIDPLPDAFFEIPTMESFQCYVNCKGDCDAFEAQEQRIRDWGKNLEFFEFDIYRP